MRDAVNVDALKAELKRQQAFHKNIRRGIYLLMGIFLSFLFIFIYSPQKDMPPTLQVFLDSNLDASQNIYHGMFSITLFFAILFSGIYYWSFARMARFINQYAPPYVVRVTPLNIITRIWSFPFVIGLVMIALIIVRFAPASVLSIMTCIYVITAFLPKIGIYLYWRFIRLAFQGGLVKVEEELRKRSNNIDLLTTKAGILMEQGQLPEAEILFRQLLERKMRWGVLNVPLLLNNLGNCLLFQERYDEASEILESAIRTNPFSGYPYDSLADCYLEQNVYPEQALELTMLALGITKSKMVDSQIIRQATAARAEAVLGNVSAAKLMLDSVERYMDKVQFAIPQMAETNRQIGYTYLALGDTDAARTYFLAATKLDPNGLYGKLARQGLEVHTDITNEIIIMNAPIAKDSIINVLPVRFLLALALMFGSEILVWTNPAGRPLLEWLLLIPGYLALSAMLLDFTIRYRVRDVFGALLLTGIYSLASALILNPAATLNDLPRTLFTRVMGSHALIATEMLGLFLALTAGGRQTRRNLLIGSAVVGMAWGIWVKNWPLEEGYGAVSLPTMLAFGGGGIALMALYLYVVLPRLQGDTFTSPPNTLSVYSEGEWRPETAEGKTHSPTTSPAITTATNDDLLTMFILTRRGWMITSGVLAVLLLVRLLQGQVIGAGLILCPLLLVLCWAIIWFRGRKRGDTLLDQHVPIRPLALPHLLLATGLFLGVGIFAYNLPDIKLGTLTPFTLIGLGFTAYGLAWLPTVALVLGAQGYLRQLATRKM